jgi:hypothetical protein
LLNRQISGGGSSFDQNTRRKTMGALLWLGLTDGLTCGLAHAVYVFNCVNHESAMVAPGNPGRPSSLMYAIWTLVVWLLFGLYEQLLLHIGHPCW